MVEAYSRLFHVSTESVGTEGSRSVLSSCSLAARLCNACLSLWQYMESPMETLLRFKQQIYGNLQVHNTNATKEKFGTLESLGIRFN